MRQQSDPILLIANADQAQRRKIAAVTSRAGWRVQAVAEADIAPTLKADSKITAVLLAQWNADLIKQLRAIAPRLPLFACADSAESIDAIRAGATNSLGLPLAADQLAAALVMAADRRGRSGELRPLTQEISYPQSFEQLAGSAPAFRAALAIAAKAARSRIPVLIEGEPGSGKTAIAHVIHAAGPRGGHPIMTVNCGAIVPGSIESHLFGYEKGAFPGAFDSHQGVLEEADGATLLVERIDALPFDIQSRLLHTLTTGEVMRIGSKGFKTVDIRFLATSNRPLAQAVSEGRFREDLYHALAMVTVTVPPLRDRRADIAPLTRHFLSQISQQPRMRPLSISDEALALLTGFGWPGNARQLQDALFRAAIFCTGPVLTPDDFPQTAHESTYHRRAGDHHAAPQSNPAHYSAPGIMLYQPDGNLRPLEEIEADIIRLAIGLYRGRMTDVARHLQIGRSTLYRKLVELGISDAA